MYARPAVKRGSGAANSQESLSVSAGQAARK